MRLGRLPCLLDAADSGQKLGGLRLQKCLLLREVLLPLGGRLLLGQAVGLVLRFLHQAGRAGEDRPGAEVDIPELDPLVGRRNSSSWLEWTMPRDLST